MNIHSNMMLACSVAAAALFGCGHPLPKPVDPMVGTGVTSLTVQEKMEDVGKYSAQRVGLVISANTKALIQWQKDEIERVNAGDAGIAVANLTGDTSATRRFGAEANDPQAFVRDVAVILKDRFKEVVTVADASEAKERKLPVVLLLDIQNSLDRASSMSGSDRLDVEWKNTIYFVSPESGSTLAVISGINKTTGCSLPKDNTYGYAWDKCKFDSRIKSLDDLASNLDRAIGHLASPKPVGKPVATHASSKETTPPPAIAKLKELQEMRNQGLITEHEFLKKKTQILDSY